MRYYSPSTRGFYDREIHGGSIPADAVELTLGEYQVLLSGQSNGKRIVPRDDGKLALEERPPATTRDVLAAKAALVQAHLDRQAQSLHYEDIRTAISYADEPAVPKFQEEGRALRAWRSLVRAAWEEIREAVESGQRAIPTDDKLQAELPPFQLD